MSLDQVRNILLVLSGKGGVGKSSVTTQLALSLCLQGHSVGILDVDLTGPSIPRFLGIEDAKVRQDVSGWMPVEVHPAMQVDVNGERVKAGGQEGEGKAMDDAQREAAEDMSTIRAEEADTHNGMHQTVHNGHRKTRVGSLKALSLALLLPSKDTSIIWRGPKKTSMVRQLLTTISWGSLDYLLIDTPPGTSDEHISLAEALLQPETISSSQNGSSPAPADILRGAVLVTTPQAIATSDVKKELNFCRKTGIRVLGIVENMSGFICPCCGDVTALFGKGGGEVMAHEWNERFLGRVPVDQTWGDLIEGKGEVKQVDEPQITGEESPEQAGALEGQQMPEDARLVERYARCMSYAIYKDITSEILDEIRKPKPNGAG